MIFKGDGNTTECDILGKPLSWSWQRDSLVVEAEGKVRIQRGKLNRLIKTDLEEKIFSKN